MSQITTLVFDIGNVLSHFSFNGIVTEAAPFTKAPIEKIREVVVKWSHPFCLGELDESDFAKHCMDDLEFTGSIDDLKRCYNTGFQPNRVMRHVIERYAPNYPLFYLSDTNPWHLDYLLEHDPLLPHFQSGTVSFEAETLKPDAAIYQFACKKHGFTPQEATFVDDRMPNVIGAKDAGFTSLHYQPNRHAAFESELAAVLDK